MKLFQKITYIVLFGLLGSNSSFGQISPGELSNAHAHLEGIDNCTQCHSTGHKVTRERCLNCHKEIKNNIASHKGYHASTEVGNKECYVCHNEHHGRKFQLIRFNKDQFNHTLTGFKLIGQHAKQECNACHQSSHIKNPTLAKRRTTYLGLSPNCLNCHDDYHQGRMSNDCSKCHNFNSFKQSTGFDHSKTDFPLVGKHRSVDCISCHRIQVINGKKFQNFNNLRHDNCTACHTDVHNNKFGQNCKQCHSEESFHLIKGIATFDHNKTDFKLIGKHQLVDCKSCHKKKLTDPIPHNQCKDCHSDYHQGQFKQQNSITDCNQCHNNNGFSPSTFTLEQHNQKFKLEGAHMATSCLECHFKNKQWQFRNLGSRCVDCHENEHKGLIQEKFFPNQECTRCHNVASWKKINFNHTQTNFKLEGVHAQTSCSNCHYRSAGNGVRTQHFQGLSMECSSCHQDSHFNQFAVDNKTDCSRCHGFEHWEASKFDHNTSRFKIEGAHKNAKCSDCHHPVMNEKGKYIEYKFDNIDCSRCHS